MVFILYFIRILPRKGSTIPGNSHILTKMHGISFAAGAPPRFRCGGGGAHIAPTPLRYQVRAGGGKGRGRRGKWKVGKGKGREGLQSL